jgi:TatD DNase family protein
MNHYLDTHFHLDLWPQALIVDTIEKHCIYTIAVTNTPSVFHYTQKITAKSKYIRAALGLHPQLATERQSELALFSELLSTTRYIGEIGLDDRSSSDFGIQKKVFKAIVNSCADAGDKILTVHSRRADKEVIDIIGQKFPGKVILHWFSGSTSVLTQAIEAGCYFSINYAMVNSASGKKLIQSIPMDRLLTESDGPFIEASGKPCNPLCISLIVKTLASVRRDLGGEENTIKLIFSNFRHLLKN